MVDQQLLSRLCDYAEVTPRDTVLEVGAGFGMLTRILAKRAGKVIAVEIDKRLVEVLRKELCNSANVQIIHGDFFTASVPEYSKVVCNPPYKESSRLIFHLLGRSFDVAVLTLQREFVHRLTAAAGSRDFSRLTVMGWVKADFEVVEEVSPEAFYPSPDVSSAVVRFKPKPKPPFAVEDWRTFEAVVRFLFTQRKRTVKKALHALVKGRPDLHVPLDHIPSSLTDARVFKLFPEDFGTIANIIARENKQP